MKYFTKINQNSATKSRDQFWEFRKSDYILECNYFIFACKHCCLTSACKRFLNLSSLCWTFYNFSNNNLYLANERNLYFVSFYPSVDSDHLFSDELYMEMALTPQLQEIVTNGSMVLSVISYKNLTNFLPRMYFERNT